MLSKIHILMALHKRAKAAKSESIPITQIHDNVMLSDSMFVDRVLQLDTQKLLMIVPEGTNWYRGYSEQCEKFFSKLTTTGKQKVLAHIKR